VVGDAVDGKSELLTTSTAARTGAAAAGVDAPAKAARLAGLWTCIATYSEKKGKMKPGTHGS